MSTPTATARVREFVARVAQHFDDLPESDRAELLQDLEEHLLELAAEHDATLDDELVTPAAYAAELRRSAGLEERRRAGLRERLSATVARVRAGRSARAVEAFLPQLRPAWWVVRAWALAVALATLARGEGVWAELPVPSPFPLGLLAVGGAVVVSVRAGLAGRDRNRWGRLVDAGAGAAALFVFLALAASPDPGPLVVYEEPHDSPPSAPLLRHADGEPITNLYVFDRDGELLEGVFVYDGRGRPVEVGGLHEAGFADIETQPRRDRSGNPVGNLYPLEQWEIEVDEAGEQRRVPRPVPSVAVPQLRGEEAPPTARPSPTPRGPLAPTPQGPLAPAARETRAARAAAGAPPPSTVAEP